MVKQKEDPRGFKGVWIPKEIWLDKKLSLIEKVFLVEIDSLDNENGCFATNEYFARFFGVSKDRCKRIISELEKKGKIIIKIDRSQLNNSKRTISGVGAKTTRPTGRKQPDGRGENNPQSNISNNPENNSPLTPKGGTDETALALSSEEEKNIGEVIHLFRDVNPTYQQLFPRKAHREAARRMIESFGMDKIRAATLFLTACISRGDRFCPRITTPLQLEAKWGDLQAHYQVVKNEAQAGIQKGGIYAI